MKNLKFILTSIFFGSIIFSCNNSTETDNQKKIDSIFPQENSNSTVSKNDSSDVENGVEEKQEKPFHLSPKDSARVADSVYHTKNGIRDFN